MEFTETEWTEENAIEEDRQMDKWTNGEMELSSLWKSSFQVSLFISSGKTKSQLSVSSFRKIYSLGRILNIRLPSVRESLSKGILLLRVSHWDVVIIP